MTGSVPSSSEVQATFSATLFDEWIRCGLRDVVLSPGSRSTPLALAVAQREELTVHVRLDERSAGFYALGRALVRCAPVVVVVTSGTAAAELHACVAEADLASVPLIVVTADRPPELHGVGAPQTIDQHRLYGPMVRRFEEPGVARLEASPSWRTMANRLWQSARGGLDSAGPVHLNVAMIEPLVARPLALPVGRAGGRPWCEVDEETSGVTSLRVEGASVLCVVGAGVSAQIVRECRELDWVVLGDATAQGTLAYFDALLRSREFAERARPDLVVRLGGLPASRVVFEQIRLWDVPVVALRGTGSVADPDGIVHASYSGVPDRESGALRGSSRYVGQWDHASRAVAAWLSTLDAGESTLNEPLVARAVVTASNERSVPLVVGSSMPVRDVEWWAPARTSATYANRGANGIDGVVSTVLGVAAGSHAIGLAGDLTMLHDVSGVMEGLGACGGSCVLVVVDNQGGGIFSFLSQATSLKPAQFEELFGTPRGQDLEGIASAFGHDATTVSTVDELRRALEKGLGGEGLSVVVAKVPSRAENVVLHERWNEHVRTLLSRGSS